MIVFSVFERIRIATGVCYISSTTSVIRSQSQKKGLVGRPYDRQNVYLKSFVFPFC